MAEEAVAIAERTDALVDHGDACLALATVLDVAGDTAGARAAAERAAGLYELKGAAALVEKARRLCVGAEIPPTAAPAERVIAAADTECVRRIRRLDAAVDREDWDDFDGLFGENVSVESRRKVVGFERLVFSSSECVREIRQICETDAVRRSHEIVAVRGERVALTRMAIGTADESPGAARDELLELFGLDTTDRLALLVSFDVEDLDEALAEMEALHVQIDEVRTRPLLENAASHVEARCDAIFDELNQRASRLDNAATRVYEHLWALFDSRSWEAVAELFTDDISNDDRRRVVNAGIERGRDVQLANLRRLADIGASVSWGTLAIRGQRLMLNRVRTSNSDLRQGEFDGEMLNVIQTGPDGRILAGVLFDRDDLDAAFAELDARYLVGEAAEHAATWSVISGNTAAFNRRELPAATRDCVDIDHRRGASFAPGDLAAYLSAASNLASEVNIYVEAVHQLTNLGAIVAHAGRSTSQDGFDAEWRVINLLTVDGDLLNRCELFDESDLDAALARFDELHRAPSPENAATCAWARLTDAFNRRDVDEMMSLTESDGHLDDRRTGVRDLKDGSERLKIVQTMFEYPPSWRLEIEHMATRGALLCLSRQILRDVDGADRPITIELLTVLEVSEDGRAHDFVNFDSGDFDSAFAELESRYLAGEASTHSRTWSLVADAYATINRHEIPTGVTHVTDHRHFSVVEGGNLIASLHAAWDLTPDGYVYIEAVHRVDRRRAVVTHVARGTGQGGFDAGWRSVNVLTVGTKGVERCELFDEPDLDVALALVEEQSHTTHLHNTARRVSERFQAAFEARDWDAMAELLADDLHNEDRRRVVNAGIRRGRDSMIEDMRAAADIGARRFDLIDIATRGERLVLVRAQTRYSETPGAFHVDNLVIGELDADGRTAAQVIFDPEDMDAAFAELDARYIAGEAAAHAHIWSLVTQTYAAFNRHELSNTTPDWVNIDHRRAVGSAPGDMNTYVSAFWSLVPDISTRIEAVHRLSNLGAVFTHTESGTSHEGFDAEWREVALLTFVGDAINHCELFDESDLDAAVARFDELNAPAPQLENAATQGNVRIADAFNRRDLAGYLGVCAADARYDDRRKGLRSEGPISAEFGHALLFDAAESWRLEVDAVALRGQHLAISRFVFRDADEADRPVVVDALVALEVNADQLVTYCLIFDPGDLGAALEELDARYLAGEAAAHAHTWSVIANANALFNRHEMPPTAPDWANIDHRQVIAFAPGEMTAYIHATWNVAPDMRNQIVAVHRLSDRGAVFTQAVCGTSHAGFNAEWRDVVVLTVDGDLLDRCEIFDDADLDAALARFDELDTG